jgi:transposase
MRLEPLCPNPAAWRIAGMIPTQDRLLLPLEPLRTAVACPVCRTPSRRVPSRYQRRPWDLPWGAWPVRLVVHARRFCCDAPACPRRIFTEPFPGGLAPDARQLERLRRVLLELAHASSAEMAARLARWLGYLGSPDTLIRQQRAEPCGSCSPRVVGVDEFALRRGQTSGTLVVDRERRRPMAVLEGRTAESLATWRLAPPEVAILVRARADASALAGRQAAPEALQVADRFLLGHNVGDARKALLDSRRWHQPTIATLPEMALVVASVRPASSAEVPGEAPQPTPRKRAVWEAVRERRGTGQSLRQIARELGLERRTLRQYLAANPAPVYPPRRPRPPQMNPDLGSLAARGAQGWHNARRRYPELVQRGYRGSESLVRVVVRPWRADQQAPPRKPVLSRLVLWPSGRLTEAEQEALERVLQANPLLARRFRQDYPALIAALTTPWSTGHCEGQICRVKLLKRLGDGRAKWDWLRQRILHRRGIPMTLAGRGCQVQPQGAA